MQKLVLIDGNSIMNRAFYGIMGSKAMTSKNGTYTNALYGFLAILFKLIEDEKPEYMAVSFDLRAPTIRHQMYEGYKANRKGMPGELAEQMPIIKEILKAMNIAIIEKEGYEGDDIIGTLSRFGEEHGLEVVILSGDRDTFQLATQNVKIKIPRTKEGKTETEIYDEKAIEEKYQIKPKQLIEVKALQGDSSDNIPGVPGIGEKTALALIQKYVDIENLYKKLEEDSVDIKPKQKEKLVENKELAILSRKLGEINLNVPLEMDLEALKIEEWDNEKVLEIFKELNFRRYIEKFDLENSQKEKNNKKIEKLYKIVNYDIEKIKENIKNEKQMCFAIKTEKEDLEENIINEKISEIAIYSKQTEEATYVEIANIQDFKEIFEDENILKIGIDFGKTYILLKQKGIDFKGLDFDISIADYILNPGNNKLDFNVLADKYLNMYLDEYLNEKDEEQKGVQMNLFADEKSKEDEQKIQQKLTFYSYLISKIADKTREEMQKINALDLFYNIDMPTVTVLADMQWNGMQADEQELEEFGQILKQQLEEKTQKIYEYAGETFNINSPKQLGVILFEKMRLPIVKKTKSGYSTDVDVLEKLKDKNPIIEELLEFRQLTKLNSTYVEGLKPYINKQTKRIHSFFHQTITATGRISSTEPNLQNIPTRFDLGKQVRKIFKPKEGNVYIDADYSQIELRILAHVSEDEQMIKAFEENQDIHKQAASKVLKIPIDEVTKEQRSRAKAVNFGIVYGISDFGLSEQLKIPRKVAKAYIEDYLEEYNGIRTFMYRVKEKAKEQGYVETMFNRRRYIPELKSNNYTVRQFGERAAMNTPIQGTAADIMKIAMIKIYRELKQNNLNAKIILQVHDEIMIESPKNEAEQVKCIVKNCMESAAKLKVPLIAEVSEATNWYDCK